jgi:RimJ/RimL family protein N-acetyltransferase
MRQSVTLSSPETPGIFLRAAGRDDCEDLRGWKNANRESFFFRQVITPEAQRVWFEAYLERADDYMFMVEVALPEPRRSIGCMGVRQQDGKADVYNVILGDARYQGQGVMASAFRLMCSFARQRLAPEVVAQVLTSNPAIGWYRKQGFDITHTVGAGEDAHHLIRLSDDRFTEVKAVQEESRA